MDFNKFKKKSQNKDHTVFVHEDGHELKVMHRSITPDQKQQLQGLGTSPKQQTRNPKLEAAHTNAKAPFNGYAEGGPVQEQPFAQLSDDSSNIPNSTPTSDPLAAETVSPEQGQSLVSASLQTPGITPTGQPEAQPVPEYEQLLKQGQQEQLQGLDTAEAAAKDAAGAQAAIPGKAAKDLQSLMDPAQATEMELSRVRQDNDKLAEALGSGKVDPNRFFANMSSGQRIANAVGLLLGGFAGPNNPAMKMLNDEVNRDVQEQERQIGTKKTLLEANLHKYKNLTDARDATRLNILKVADLKLAQAQAKTQSQVMQAQIQQQRGQLHQSMSVTEAQLAGNRALQQMMGGNGAADVHPAQLVPKLVPEAHQAQVFKEIESAENVAKNKNKMIQLFDSASKDETFLKRAGGLRGEAASKKALEGLMVSQIPIVDQTVRQYAAEAAFNSFLPAKGDTEATIAIKRKGFQDWMNSNAKGVTAKGYGLDLNRFKATKQQDVPQIQHKAPNLK